MDFVTSHNELMVQTMLVLVVVWSAFMLGTWVYERARAGGSEDRKDETLTSDQVINVTVAAEAAAQVAKLQSELQARVQEVEALKAKVETAPTPGSSPGSSPAVESADISKYLKQIQELEGKLAEYEILEDDIADLSLYKDENIRLKAELQKLGKTLSPSDESAPTVSAEEPPQAQAAVTLEKAADQVAPPATPTAETAPATAELLAAEPPAAAESVTAEAPPAAEPAFEEFLKDPAVEEKSEAIVREFAVAVEGNKAPEGEVTGDDLLSEFAASISEPSAADDKEGLDTDKMMAELASLENLEDDGGSSLEGESDIEKMAAEADKLVGS